MKHSLIYYFILLLCAPSLSAPLPQEITGMEVLSKKAIHHSFSSAKNATVVVFLSAKCPCSASHEVLLKELQTEFKDFPFIGIHANADEPLDITESHFKASELPFPILQDNKSFWADQLGALKTPHAFVINTKGEIIYQGGVTDSHIGPTAKKQFLKEVLTDLTEDKKPRHTLGRALGCYIQRED